MNPGGMAGGPPGGGGAAPVRVLPTRQVLHVALTNHAATPLAISVTDVTSLLGNFAVRPEHLTIAPGETAELEPMMANSADNYEELDVTLAIRKDGHTDQQTLALKLVSPSTGPE